jgi:hypothetical protein
MQYFCATIYSSGRRMKGKLLLKSFYGLEWTTERDRRKSFCFPEEEGIMNL